MIVVCSHRVLDAARLLVAVDAHPQLYRVVHFKHALAAAKRAADLKGAIEKEIERDREKKRDEMGVCVCVLVGFCLTSI